MFILLYKVVRDKTIGDYRKGKRNLQHIIVFLKHNHQWKTPGQYNFLVMFVLFFKVDPQTLS